jgi:hypothetical protein
MPDSKRESFFKKLKEESSLLKNKQDFENNAYFKGINQKEMNLLRKYLQAIVRSISSEQKQEKTREFYATETSSSNRDY